MADKRMLTKKVTDDDDFSALSSSAQALYLHLCMSADDDGFTKQISISMFRAHASVQDLEALLERRYVYQFDSGVIVIRHWRMANALRKDRYTKTIFLEELSKLQLETTGEYTMATDGCQMVAIGLPQDRLDEDITADDVAPDRVCIYASNNLSYLSPNNMEELLSFKDSLTDDMIIHAIDQACSAGKRTYAYVKSILNRMIERGFKTLGEVLVAEEERRKKNSDPEEAQKQDAIRSAKRTHKPMDERVYVENKLDDPLQIMQALMNRPRSGDA